MLQVDHALVRLWKTLPIHTTRAPLTHYKKATTGQCPLDRTTGLRGPATSLALPGDSPVWRSGRVVATGTPQWYQRLGRQAKFFRNFVGLV
jgi:hypothetical protein